MFSESFRALFKDAFVALEGVVHTAGLASSLALAVDHQVSFWASDSDAFTINHRELSRARHFFAFVVDLGVAFRTLFHDALFSVHGVASWASFKNALLSLLLISLWTFRNVIAFSVFENEIFRALESFTFVVFSESEMRWAFVENAGVGGLAPSVARVAADFVAFTISEFVASLALDSDA